MASKHRLRPLLYYNLNNVCPEKVPEDFLKYLKDFYHSNTHKNLLFTGELIKIMELLKENKINAFTYKGPVLAHIAYGNIGLREFGDIDIFIDKSDALKAKEVMLKNDYILDPPIKAEDRIYMKLESEYRFKNKNNNVKVEINWNFEGTFFSLKNKNLLFNEFDINGLNRFDITTPSVDNHFIMLCIHAAKHNWRRLEWICDISEYYNNTKIDWDIVFKRVKILGIERIVLVNINLAKELFDYNLSEKVNLDVNSYYIKMISTKIKKQIFLGLKPNIVEIFYLDLIKRENLINLLIDFINYIKKPSYLDYEDLKLPNYLFPIYHLLRPILLLKRYI